MLSLLSLLLYLGRGDLDLSRLKSSEDMQLICVARATRADSIFLIFYSWRYFPDFKNNALRDIGSCHKDGSILMSNRSSFLLVCSLSDDEVIPRSVFVCGDATDKAMEELNNDLKKADDKLDETKWKLQERYQQVKNGISRRKKDVAGTYVYACIQKSKRRIDCSKKLLRIRYAFKCHRNQRHEETLSM
ncbi:hypothetical protein Tco_1372754, partial [Tanacetum coccineum]